MGVARTKTVKNKHATRGSGIKNSKAASRVENDPVVRAKKNKNGGKAPLKPSQIVKELQKKRKKKVYSEKELGIPELNMVTPIGVEKPKGKKKGKVFVDDRVRKAPVHHPRQALCLCLQFR
jgi:60S ribosomal subunit assembly/export protein LOC1